MRRQDIRYYVRNGFEVRRIKTNSLIESIDKLHTTEMCIRRIKMNCQIETNDVVQWSRELILNRTARIERIGKNWYVLADNYRITVNAHSYTIITAHKVKI